MPETFCLRKKLNALPMVEMLAKLGLKGGQNNLNMNIKPEQEVPFMLVFHNLPEGLDQYRIDTVGSDPVQAAPMKLWERFLSEVFK